MPTLRVSSPLRGVNTVVNREGQTPDTCWSATNMLPYDRFGRRRVAQRSGLVKQFAGQLGSTQIQGMLPFNNITYAGTIGSTSIVSTALSSFSHVPATVSIAGNSVSWPAGYSDPGGTAGVVVNSTITRGFTLDFGLTFTGNSTINQGNNLYLSFNQGSTTLGNVLAGNDEIDVQYAYNPITQSVHVEVDVNNSTGFFAAVGNSTGLIPFGSTIACSLIWDGAGNVSATMGPVSTVGSVQQTSTASTMQIWGDPGASVATSTSGMNFVQGSTTTVSTGSIAYQTLLIAVCQGFVWVSQPDGTIAKAANGQSTALINSTNIVSMCQCQGIVFITDGVRLVTYTIATDTVAVAAAVPSPGNITGTVPPNCALICNWRGRIVLAGDSGNPQNYYMSRVPGTYFNTVTSTNVAIGPGADWDFSQTDGAAAFAGNNNTGLQIGEPIVALMPFSNDYLKMGCSHSLWMYQGDPAVNGNLVNVSQDIGVVGKDAWCVDPAGTMWFVATGGLYHVRPAWEAYRPPEPVSLQSVNQAFRSLNPGEQRVVLVYDPDLHYLHVFGSPVFVGNATHLTMDARSMDGQGSPGFWPQIFPNAAGPVCACTFFSDGNPNNRVILMGGFDGYIRGWTDTATDDDGTAISAGVTLGPFAPIPDEAAILTGTTIDMGEAPLQYGSTAWNVNVIIAAGPDAYSVTEGLNNNANPHPIPHINGLTLDRRQKTFRQRVRGGWFTISLQNLTDNTFFSFESAALEFVPAGHNRLRR